MRSRLSYIRHRDKVKSVYGHDEQAATNQPDYQTRRRSVPVEQHQKEKKCAGRAEGCLLPSAQVTHSLSIRLGGRKSAQISPGDTRGRWTTSTATGKDYPSRKLPFTSFEV
ncbi:hypothetical protein MRX96_043489 [Rhipicephalus microplus]